MLGDAEGNTIVMFYYAQHWRLYSKNPWTTFNAQYKSIKVFYYRNKSNMVRDYMNVSWEIPL